MIDLVVRIAERHRRREIDRARAVGELERIAGEIVALAPLPWMAAPLNRAMRLLVDEVIAAPVEKWPTLWARAGHAALARARALRVARANQVRR